MKYPCNTIRDLLPLYIDKVCSSESREIVETHLQSCAECKAYYQTMMETEENMELVHDNDFECQKASSFRAVKRKVLRKQILAAVIAVLLIVAAGFGVVGVLKRSSKIVAFNKNLSVSMVEGSLMGRLYGSEHTNVKIKRVSALQNGREGEYLFYEVSDTKWNDLITNENVFSEYVLCPKEKSADQIDYVYYYTGEYTDLENLNDAEFETVLQNSTLLWQKEK